MAAGDLFVNVYHVHRLKGLERGRAVRSHPIRSQVLYSNNSIFYKEKKWCEDKTVLTAGNPISGRFEVRVESKPAQDYDWRAP